jgi:prepilin-type processing-associated H-X9-DG protein
MVVLMSRTHTWMTGLAVAAALAAVSLRAQSPAPPAGQTVEVTAERFAFQPSEITVAVGTTLTVVLKSDDTTHGFRIKGEGVNIQIPKRGRGTATATYTPTVGNGLEGTDVPPTDISGYTAGKYSPNGHTEWVDGKVHESGFTTTFTPNAKTVISGVGAPAGNPIIGDFVSCREGGATCAGLPTYAAVTARSYHAGMVNILLMDGSVRSASDSINLTVWRNLGARNDGNPIGDY